MSNHEFKKRLRKLARKAENQKCADCSSPFPRWASIIVPPPGSPPDSKPIGAFCCILCSGSHRSLGVHISFVRSLSLDEWKEHEVLAMERGGNHKVNAIFEAKHNNNELIFNNNDTARKPQGDAELHIRESYIRAKYEQRLFYDPDVFLAYSEGEEMIPLLSSANSCNNKQQVELSGSCNNNKNEPSAESNSDHSSFRPLDREVDKRQTSSSSATMYSSPSRNKSSALVSSSASWRNKKRIGRTNKPWNPIKVFRKITTPRKQTLQIW